MEKFKEEGEKAKEAEWWTLRAKRSKKGQQYNNVKAFLNTGTQLPSFIRFSFLSPSNFNTVNTFQQSKCSTITTFLSSFFIHKCNTRTQPTEYIAAPAGQQRCRKQQHQQRTEHEWNKKRKKRRAEKKKKQILCARGEFMFS